jgi:SAM-dependent methyltransferase
MVKRVDYDRIAPVFDERYRTGTLPGVAEALREAATEAGARSILDAGCGTGYWLDLFLPAEDALVCGLDRSLGMLRKARERHPKAPLARGDANALPFRPQSFDLVFCINALHHFDDPEGFVRESIRMIRPGGSLAIIGEDPHAGRDSWYVYDYFPGTWEMDLHRFPSMETKKGWMRSSGYERIESSTPCRIQKTYIGREVLLNPFIRKRASSQLALLSDDAYRAGLNAIEEALDGAEGRGEELRFEADLHLDLLIGQVPR